MHPRGLQAGFREGGCSSQPHAPPTPGAPPEVARPLPVVAALLSGTALSLWLRAAPLALAPGHRG